MEFLNREYKEINVVGDFVVIEKNSSDDLRQEGGIYIPTTAKFENCRIGVGKIVKMNEKTMKDTGLKIGDYVMYDYHGAHNPKDKHVITNAENIFMQLTEKEASEFLNGGLQI